MLGERYGWIPPSGVYAADLLERQPWLRQHQGGKSVTELEILHGVLNDPAMAGRAFFYFRSPAYAGEKGGDYLPGPDEDASRLAHLKARIRQSGFPVVEDYTHPGAFAARLQEDLWRVLEGAFPTDEVPDAFERESMRHESYAAPRRRLYLGGEGYLAALDEALAAGAQRVLVEGASGGGKSALLANWTEAHRKGHAHDLVHTHYTGASADAADPHAVVRRLCEAIRRTTGSDEELPEDPQKLMEALPLWLAYASAYADKEGRRWVIVIDALNGITALQDLRWWPEFLPARVHVVVSCLPGTTRDALKAKGPWRTIAVEPLDEAARRTLLLAYLGRYNKTLPVTLQTRALGHPLAVNPLFLRTLAEELRLFGEHERLEERLEHYLESRTVDDLYERVLARVEVDCGEEAVRRSLTAIWASRAGLTEEEIQGIAGLVPATWAPIRFALDDALLESGGRIALAHDYLRIAISDRYLSGNGMLDAGSQSDDAKMRQRAIHEALALWFESAWLRGDETAITAARAAEEAPHQWRAARNWSRLKTSLTTRAMFSAIRDNRSDEELLSYWLDLEREVAADMEADYEVAWSDWEMPEEEEATGDLASNLSGLLRYAGRYKVFTLRTAQTALAITEKVRGPEHPSTWSCLNNLAVLLEDQGTYAAAEPLCRRALAIAEKVRGSEHPETGVSLNNLAGLLQEQGDCAAAEPLFRRALAIAEKAEGPEHPSTGMYANNLALLLQAQGDYAAAEPLFRRALAIAEKAQGPGHPDTGIRLSNLALLIQAQGDYAVAEPLCRRALAIAEKAQGPEHPSTGISLNNLAGLLNAQGACAAAEPLYRRALAIAEKVQGLEHPSTGITLNNLAELLREQGDYAAAEPLCRRALAIAEKVQGSEHPETGVSLNNLAGLIQEQGDYAAAEPLFRRALAIAEKAQGPGHPNTGIRLRNLANVLRAQGTYAAAEPLYRRALAITEKAEGPEHPSTGITLNNLAEILREQGDYAAAEPLLRRALAIAEKAEGPEHPSTGITLNNLAEILREQGDYAAAEPLFRRALAIAEKAEGPEHPSTGISLNNLAGLLRAQGDYAAAESFYRRALAIAEKAEGPEHPSTAICLTNLAGLLQARGDCAAAEPLYRRALAIVAEKHGPDHEEVMGTLTGLGDTLLEMEKIAEAEDALTRAVEIASKLNFGGPFFQLGQLRLDQKDYGDAERLLRRCLKIRREKLAPDDEAIRMTLESLAEVCRLTGREDEAKALLADWRKP